MSSDVKRYSYGQGETFECDDGEFVEYTDYDRAIAERDAAQAEVERLKSKLDEICDRLYQVKERWADSIDDKLKAECQLEANQSGCVVQVNIHGMCAARFKPNLVEHYKACIAEQSETCAADKKRIAELEADTDALSRLAFDHSERLDEAVGLLRRWDDPRDDEFNLVSATEDFLAAYDAEQANAGAQQDSADQKP